MRKLKAVLLVGGFGTRLRPLTDNKPKPIVPVVNRPFLEHSLAHLKQFGVDEVILAMSYLPEVISEYFKDGERCGMRLTYCMEKEPLGTAGAVKNAAAYLDGPFIVLNGDNVFIELNLDEVYAFHREKKAKATICLTRVDNPSAFGVVETDASRRVKAFIEKPAPGTATTDWINAGGYILEPEVLEHVPAGQYYMFEKGLFPHLLEIGAPVYGYHYKGYWLDMGTPAKYLTLNADMLAGKLSNRLLPECGEGGFYYGEDTKIDPSAVIKPPVVIGDGCRIGCGVGITGPAVIGQDCHLEDGVNLENAVIWDRVNIGAGSRLSRCIISSDVTIGENQDIGNTVITPARTAPLPLPDANVV
ncbi:MAG: NDP-sugar synthase [Dehalococcoidales bacterium]